MTGDIPSSRAQLRLDVILSQPRYREGHPRSAVAFLEIEPLTIVCSQEFQLHLQKHFLISAPLH